ncbi:O-antigen ligase family protein [Candidatus Microgenomates bacterium]|nr:O-antigen ligase family protein [Candidatus Microgenomates bacterium]
MKIIRTLFLVLILIFPFGQLTRIPLGISSVNFYFQDIIIVLFVFSWLILCFLKKKKLVLPPLAKPIFGFISIAFISWTLNAYQYSTQEAIIAFLYLLRWIFYAGVYFVVSDLVRFSRDSIDRLLIGAGVVSAIIGLLQYIFLHDTRFLYYSGWDDHYYRIIGAFLDPGFTGLIYVLALILIVKKCKTKKSIYYLLFAICYLAMSLTYSRASFLAYLVGMAVIAWFKKSWQFFTVVFLVLAVTIILLPRPAGEGVKLERQSSVQARVGSFNNVLKIIKDNPILGVGFNFYRYAQRDYGFSGEDWQVSHAGAGVDSSLFFVWVTTGIFGLIAYLWLLWRMVKLYPVSLLAVISHSFFNNSLFYSWIMLWLWILLGIKENKKE